MAPTLSDSSTATVPWESDADDVIAGLKADRVAGLSGVEVQRRAQIFGRNELTKAAAVSPLQRLAAQLRDPMVVLLLVATAISLVAWVLEGAESVPFDAAVIVLIVTANAFLGLWQERRAEQAVAALQRMTATHSTVIRNSEVRSILSAELVPGDLLLLAEGDAVGADGRVIESATLMVAEAALTGESEPAHKMVDALPDSMVSDRTNMVHSGTAVAAGRGVAIVTAIGMNTEVGAIAALLDRAAPDRTPLQRELDWVSKLLGVTVVGLSTVVVGAILVTSDINTASDMVDALLVGVSLAVAAVPEGLPAILSVVLAIGVQRMAGKNALVKKLSSVETLGSASVICTDKTGTLTRNEMTITTVVSASGTVDISGSGYAPFGQVMVNGSQLGDGPLLDEVKLVIGAGSLANNSSLGQTSDGTWEVLGDPTEAAFLVAEAKLGIQASRRERFERIDEIPFSSERKLMTTVERDSDESTPEFVIITKGAPDVLLTRCSHERVAGAVVPLTPHRRAEVLADVDRLADQALRTLAVAHREIPTIEVAHDAMESDLVFLGLVGIIDPPRPEARDAIAAAAKAGIRVIAITGDHPRTAARIAEQVGLTTAGSAGMTGQALDQLGQAETDRAIDEVAVFSRVAPEHKLRIVEALQARGNVVAMTGDGVNDAPALRQADIGVAMGITGTEVSKEAADMILTNDDFATILNGVSEGRTIFANIAKFLRYLLSSNTGEVLVMFIGILAGGIIGLTGAGDGLAVPLLATQILWINLLTDTGLALALGIDPEIDDVMARPPRNLDDKIIDRDMGVTILLTGLVMACIGLVALDLELVGGPLGGSGDLASARTHVFSTLVLASIFCAFNSRSTRHSAFHRLFTNPALWVAAALTVVLQLAVVHVGLMNEAFDTVPMTAKDWLTVAALASAVLWVEELRKLAVRWNSKS